MKKIIVLLILAVIAGTTANAQIVHAKKVTADSYKKIEYKEPKPKMDYNWFVKGGLGLLRTSEGEEYGSDNFNTFKYDVSLGYQHQISKGGFYLGGILGLGNYSNIYSVGTEEETYIGIYIEPLIGIKRYLGSERTLDIHGALGYGYEFCDDGDGDMIIWELGGGVWFNRLYMGLGYKGAFSGDLNTGILLEAAIRF